MFPRNVTQHNSARAQGTQGGTKTLALNKIKLETTIMGIYPYGND